MAPTIAVLILLACLGLAFLPIMVSAGPEEGGEEDLDPAEALAAERKALLDDIREVDMDLTMGKMTAKDHAELRAGLESRALLVLSQLEALEGGGEEE